MPLYEYECTECSHKFDHRLPMSRRDEAIECPKCQGKTRRLISGGSGFIIKGGTRSGIVRDLPVRQGPCCKEQGKASGCCPSDKGECAEKRKAGCGDHGCKGH